MIKMFYIPVRIFPTPVNSSDFYGQGKNCTHKYLYNNLKMNIEDIEIDSHII